MIATHWLNPGEDLKHPFQIREEVFVREQKFTDEYDEWDPVSFHLVLYDGENPVGCGRLRAYPEQPGDYKLERIAVLKSHRGTGLGASIIEEMEKKAHALGGNRAWLHGQCQAEEFYRKLGYAAVGEADYEQYCSHIMMRKTLGLGLSFRWNHEDGTDTLSVTKGDKLAAEGEGRHAEEGEYQILKLAVREECRNLGLGELLLYNLERHAFLTGAHTAVLNTPQFSESFFSKRGYSSFGDNRRGIVYLLKVLEPRPEDLSPDTPHI